MAWRNDAGIGGGREIIATGVRKLGTQIGQTGESAHAGCAGRAAPDPGANPARGFWFRSPARLPGLIENWPSARPARWFGAGVPNAQRMSFAITMTALVCSRYGPAPRIGNSFFFGVCTGFVGWRPTGIKVQHQAAAHARQAQHEGGGWPHPEPERKHHPELVEGRGRCPVSSKFQGRAKSAALRWSPRQNSRHNSAVSPPKKFLAGGEVGKLHDHEGPVIWVAGIIEHRAARPT